MTLPSLAINALIIAILLAICGIGLFITLVNFGAAANEDDDPHPNEFEASINRWREMSDRNGQ